MKNLSLKQKLMSLCLSIAILSPIVGGTSFILSKNVFEQYDKITLITLPNTEHLGTMDSAYKNIMRYMWRSLLVKDETEKEKVFDLVDESIKIFNTNQKAYASVEFVPGEQELYQPIEVSWKVITNSIAKFKTVPVSGLYAEYLDPEFQKHVVGLEKSITALIEFQKKVAADRHKQTESMREQTVTVLITITILSLVIAGFAGAYFARLLAANLQNISNLLADAGIQVSSAAKQIQEASLDLSQATTQQAASLEETAASIEELNSTIKKNSENAKDASHLSNESHEKAENGKHVMNKMLQAINEIDQSNNVIVNEIDNSNKKIEEIIHVISDIGEKTKVINDIVFQTKLLSFNASVEAARAGENGKGFAVVAEEVGNLAQMSGNAANEISSMLDQSIKKVETIVEETKASVHRLVQEGKSKISAGSEIAHECSFVLEDIAASVSKVSRMSEEISVASAEQAQGVQEITKAVHQMDEATQQNTATTQETASASQQLSSQADSLKAIVDQLVKTVSGKNPEFASNVVNISEDGPKLKAKFLRKSA